MSRVKIKGVLVLLPKKLVKNNIFQRFIALKTKIKFDKQNSLNIFNGLSALSVINSLIMIGEVWGLIFN